MTYKHATFGQHNAFYDVIWDYLIKAGVYLSIAEIMQSASEKADWMRFERELLNLLK